MNNNIREEEYIDDDFQDIMNVEDETNLVTKLNTPINIILIILNILVIIAIIVVLLVL